jgi:superfamily II DNA/RNA helicase
MQNNNGWLGKALENLKIKSLNDMQQAAMLPIQNGQDVVLLSATGSGKTLAFLLPLVPQLQQSPNTASVLIIVPSRELAMQIEQVFKSLQLNLKVTCCYGGHKREIEENNLVQPPALLVGTPGRLADHIRRGNINTATITTVVMDEFDKTLELGFTEEVSFIINALSGLKQRVLTSATQMNDIPALMRLNEPVELNFLTGQEQAALEIKTLLSPDKDKLQTLFRLICMLGNRLTIIFCNHREAVERTSSLLKEKDIVNVFYHGAMEQQERDAALSKFRNGTSSILVTTDLAARGLDIAHIRYIIHYHLPQGEDIFTHRNGRTARMDASGTAIVLLGPDEKMPPYIPADAPVITLPETAEIPEKPKWTTLFIAAGKKDKVNKVDIVGFLSNKAQLKKEDIGLIDVKDFFSFVAVKKIKAAHTMHLIKDEKIKNKKVKMAIAK